VNQHAFVKPHRHAQDVLSAEVLAAFDGRGTVRILERRPDAVVLERLEPGTPLAVLAGNGEDDEATRILARTIRQMRADTIPPGVPTAADLGASFARYLKDRTSEVPAPLVQTAMHVYFDLCASQTNVRLLHGDLHHDNVLFDARREWIAIDPKGVIGELEYELAAGLRNPIDRPDVFGDPRGFDRRVNRFARDLPVDAGRVKRWAFATAVLAAIWTVEDADDPALRQHWIAFAQSIQPPR
jgi:streptomycin 6-kinase